MSNIGNSPRAVSFKKKTDALVREKAYNICSEAVKRIVGQK
jgi:hypothetical protein